MFRKKNRPSLSPAHLSHAAHLIGVDVDDFVHVKRKEDVEEQDLVAPDNPLLLALATKPLWPLVRHELHAEPGQPNPNPTPNPTPTQPDRTEQKSDLKENILRDREPIQ